MEQPTGGYRQTASRVQARHRPISTDPEAMKRVRIANGCWIRNLDQLAGKRFPEV
jgi:hypothetical protein